MTSRVIIPFSDPLGFSRLFQDFVYHPERLAPFFGRITDSDRAAALVRASFPRREMTEILMRQNRMWQAPPAVIATIDKLMQPETLVVSSAHQACLFGGPYMILLKALGAAALADRLERELSVPVIPIFWIAGDDHDVKEISFADLFDQSGMSVRLQVDFDDRRVYPPVGRVAYDDSVAREVARLEELLPQNDFRDAVLAPLSRAYRPGKGMVDCFAEYIHHLMGHLGIPLFSPYDEQYKKLVAPLFHDLIGKRREIRAIFEQTSADLTAAGYHLQVHKAAEAVHLFHHTPERRAVHSRGEGFAIGDRELSKTELDSLITRNPVDFSPDVITRAVMQSYAFPVIGVVGGPAEIAYFAQLMPLFELFGLTRPLLMPRPSLTLVENRFAKLMERNQWRFEDVTVRADETINRLMEGSFPAELETGLIDLAHVFQGQINGLQKALTTLDPVLVDTATRTGERIDFLVNELRKKVFAAHKKKSAGDRDKVDQAYRQLFPQRALAERSIASIYFVSRYGPGVVDFIRENLISGETGHRLLLLSEYHG